MKNLIKPAKLKVGDAIAAVTLRGGCSERTNSVKEIFSILESSVV